MDIGKIQNFYETPLGHYARGVLRSKLKKNLDGKSKTILASLGAYAYVEDYLTDGGDLFFQTYKQDLKFPECAQGRVVESSRYQWPHRAESVDALIMGHDIEFADDIDAYLREVWRVLKGEGQVFIVIPSRKGRWIRGDHTPFGYGQACHLKNLRRSFEKTHFKIDHIVPSLFFPPYEPKTKIGHWERDFVDMVGEYCGISAGVYIIELSKHIYAPTRGLKEMVSAPATRLLRPTKARARTSSPKMEVNNVRRERDV